MRGRRKTILEKRWPNTSDFLAIAKAWKNDASAVLLSFIWQGYDLLQADVLSQIEPSQTDAELERSVTQLLEPRIRRAMSGDEPFFIQHEVYEHETRQASPAQPPQYDMAFVLYSNPRIMWPLEAKVLRTDGAIAPYIKDLKNEFLSCRYAPFSSEGSMVGYLFSGNTSAVFRNIEKNISCKLHQLSRFIERTHRYSEHVRDVPENKHYPSHFRCQHVILQIIKEEIATG